MLFQRDRTRVASLLAVLLGYFLLCGVGSAVAAQRSAALDALIASTPENQPLPVVLFLDNRITMDEIYPVAQSLPMSERRAYVIRTLKERFAVMSEALLPTLDAARQSGDVGRVRPLWILNAVRTEISPRALNSLDAVLPEVTYMAADLPHDNTLDDMGWGIREMQVERIWAEYGADGSGVILAHKDAGVNVNHPGFAGHLWINPGEDLNGNGTIDDGESNNLDDDGNGYVDDFHGWDFDRDESDILDSQDAGGQFGHGTKTAGVITAAFTPCDTVAGAPGAKLMVLSAFVLQGALWEASQYAIEMGASVISASVSFKQTSCDGVGDCPNYVAHRLVSEIELAAGILHANSTGNVVGIVPLGIPAPANSPPPVMLPGHTQQGGVSSMVSVNAYGSMGQWVSGGLGPASWSRDDICVHPRMPFCGPEGSPTAYPPQYNDYPYQGGTRPGLLKPDVCAPTSVNTLNPTNPPCSVIGGTSGATPHVGAAIALIYSAFPGITPEQAYVVLMENLVDAGPAGWDPQYGFGKIRPYNAITAGRLGRGEIHGVITAAGQPLEGVRVAADTTQAVYTNAEGEYVLALPVGEHEVSVFKYGYQLHSETVTITAGQSVATDITLQPAALATLTGSVSGTGAGALGGIAVRIPDAELETVTDPNGAFTFTMYEGRYTLLAGGLPWDDYVLEFDLEPGTLDLDIVLSRSVRALPTGPDTAGYYIYDNFDSDSVAYEWIEINPNAGGLPGTVLNVGNDGNSRQTLPFTFRFYGQDYTQINVGSNGFIMLGTGSYLDYLFPPIPSEAPPNGFLAPWFSDWQPSVGGRVLYYSDPQNHQAIVEWYGVPHYWGGRSVTFQAILYDPQFYPTPTGDGIVKYQYHTVTEGHEAVIGLENMTGTDGVQYQFQLVYDEHAAPLAAGRALLITTDSTLGSLAVPVERPALPTEFSLAQNYPNPFNPTTTFTWTVPQSAEVRLALYDVMGREAAVIYEGRCEAGEYRQTFQAHGLATGLYFARLESAGETLDVRKVMLLK